MRQLADAEGLLTAPAEAFAPAFLIAEVAQAHDGSLGFAHAFIDLAREVGADAIKFQTHIAAAETRRVVEAAKAANAHQLILTKVDQAGMAVSLRGPRSIA